MNPNSRKPARRPFGEGLDEPAKPANEAPNPMPRGFVDVFADCYVPSDRESLSWSRWQDKRDQAELNPNGFRPPQRKRRGGYRR
jgi:hypothetical protein